MTQQPLSAYLQAAFRAQARIVRETAEALRGAEDPASPEALHQFRVQLRRLRSALRAARPVLGKFHVRAIESSLGELIDLTNPTRDAEVLLPRLRSAELSPETTAEAEPTLERWEEQARRARRKLRRALDSGALDQSLRWLEALIELPVHPERDGPAGRLARRAVSINTDVFMTGLARIDQIMDDADALHSLRLSAKRLRYLIDFYKPLLRKRQRRLEPLARGMQAELGELHDTDVLLQRIGKMRGLDSSARAELLAWAEAERERHAGQVRTHGLDALDQAEALLSK